MNILVCGGRDYGKLNYEFATGKIIEDRRAREHRNGLIWLDLLIKSRGLLAHNITIISGGATGGDTIGEDWSFSRGSKLHRFPAQWNLHGKSAGYVRNRQMLTEGKPDLIVAFPGGVGTYNMIQLGREAKIEVIQPSGVNA